MGETCFADDLPSEPERLYPQMREEFLLEGKNQFCSAKLPGCSIFSTDVHHMAGRGVHLLNVHTWLAVCRKCHDRITTNSREAILLGLSISRLGKYQDWEMNTESQPEVSSSRPDFDH